MNILLIVFVMAVLLFGLVGNSYAHKSQTIGNYEISVGWKDEPPIVGEDNAIEITITVSPENTNQTLIVGSGVSELSDNLEAYVSLNGKKTPLDISETKHLGVYIADFTPTDSGHPMVNLYGVINGDEIEVTLHPEKINEPIKPHTELTDNGTLGVTLSTEPQTIEKNDNSKIKIDFLNLHSGKIQEHIDYKVEIKNNDGTVFGPIPLTHTSKGSVSIPYTFEHDGSYTIIVYVEGVLFQPIPVETVQFSLEVGNTHDDMDIHMDKTNNMNNVEKVNIPTWIKNNAGWWAQGTIDDQSFVQGIQFLIKEDIIRIPFNNTAQDHESNDIPPWIKNNAGWWAQDIISDSDFLSGIQYLVSNGIVKV